MKDQNSKPDADLPENSGLAETEATRSDPLDPRLAEFLGEFLEQSGSSPDETQNYLNEHLPRDSSLGSMLATVIESAQAVDSLLGDGQRG